MGLSSSPRSSISIQCTGFFIGHGRTADPTGAEPKSGSLMTSHPASEAFEADFGVDSVSCQKGERGSRQRLRKAVHIEANDFDEASGVDLASEAEAGGLGDAAFDLG